MIYPRATDAAEALRAIRLADRSRDVFGGYSEDRLTDTLALLYATIEARAGGDPATSHTAALLAQGPARCAEKFGEEAIETIVAAAQGDARALTREAADALYHLQVLLRACGVRWEAVLAELETREGRSGVAEKAARPR